jgi:hypothetical protein
MKSSGRSPFILHRAHDAQPEHAAAFTNRWGDSWDIARTIHSSSSCALTMMHIVRELGIWDACLPSSHSAFWGCPIYLPYSIYSDHIP